MSRTDGVMHLLRRANPAPPGAVIPDPERAQRLLDALAERNRDMDTKEFTRLIEPLLPPRPPWWRRPGLVGGVAVVAVAVVLVAGGLVGGWFDGDDEPADVAGPATTATTAPAATTSPAAASTPAATTAPTATTVAEAAAWPPALLEQVVVFDTESNLLIAFGGGKPGGSVATAETWVFDPTTETWEQRNPARRPGLRVAAAAAYHPTLDRMVIYGGWADASFLWDDMWLYDADTDTWDEVVLLGASPPPAATIDTTLDMIYVDSLDTLLLYEYSQEQARTPTGQPPGQVWLFDADASMWQPIGEIPEQWIYKLVYDPVADVVVAASASTSEQRIWLFDPSTLTWSSTAVPGGWVHPSVFDPVGERIVGFDATWTFGSGESLVLSTVGLDDLTIEPLAAAGAVAPVKPGFWAVDETRNIVWVYGDRLHAFQPDPAGELFQLDLVTMTWRLVGPQN